MIFVKAQFSTFPIRDIAKNYYIIEKEKCQLPGVWQRDFLTDYLEKPICLWYNLSQTVFTFRKYESIPKMKG